MTKILLVVKLVVERNLSSFSKIFVHFQQGIKNPEALIFKASGRLGEKIRTSGLLNPIQARNIDK